MAEYEHEREDLIATATALVQRVELSIEGFTDFLVIGFRHNGAASLFVGADPVYQFNGKGELRRGYRAGKLVKAESGRLVEMRRQRVEGRFDLVRHELSDEQTVEFLGELRHTLDRLVTVLEKKQYRVAGQVPADQDVVAQSCQWLAGLSDPIPIAMVANVS